MGYVARQGKPVMVGMAHVVGGIIAGVADVESLMTVNDIPDIDLRGGVNKVGETITLCIETELNDFYFSLSS